MAIQYLLEYSLFLSRKFMRETAHIDLYMACNVMCEPVNDDGLLGVLCQYNSVFLTQLYHVFGSTRKIRVACQREAQPTVHAAHRRVYHTDPRPATNCVISCLTEAWVDNLRPVRVVRAGCYVQTTMLSRNIAVRTSQRLTSIIKWCIYISIADIDENVQQDRLLANKSMYVAQLNTTAHCGS